jgi:hypothetical protein
MQTIAHRPSVSDIRSPDAPERPQGNRLALSGEPAIVGQ